MPWLAAVIVAVLVALGLKSRKRRTFLMGHKPRKEWCIVIVHEDKDGNVSFIERPGPMRTSQQRKFNWLVFGECDDGAPQNDYEIVIDQFKKKKDATPVDYLFDDKEFRGKVPKTQEGDPEHIKAKVKRQAKDEDVEYTYRICVQPASKGSARAEADGEFEVCPVWPCGDGRKKEKA